MPSSAGGGKSSTQTSSASHESRRKFFALGEWEVIAAGIATQFPSADLTGLRERLEEYGRDYVATADPDHRKAASEKRDRVAEFRKMIETDLPPELLARATAVMRDIEDHYRDQVARLNHYGHKITYEAGPGWYRSSNLNVPLPNAQKAALDYYFGELTREYKDISGQLTWPQNTKSIRIFIAACAKPVAGPMSDRKISERLYRSRKRMRAEVDKHWDNHQAALARNAAAFSRAQTLTACCTQTNPDPRFVCGPKVDDIHRNRSI
jgi:hypothetical protein